MIYIFQGFQGICSLPGYACQACGEACKTCPSICRACSTSCVGCGAHFKHFMERPLSAYVVISCAVSAGAVLSAQSSSSDPPGCTSIFLLILQLFSVVNVVFAIYAMCAVWSKIDTPENRETEFIDGDLPPKGYAFSPDKIIVPTKVVQDAFRKVFMEDLVVLLMFFALLGMFALSWQGPHVVDGEFGGSAPLCNVERSMARESGKLFFWIAFLYSFLYMWCSCCASKVTIKKDTGSDEESRPQLVPLAPPA